MIKKKTISFIGAGNMGGALIGGLAASSAVDRKNIVVSDPRKARIKELSSSLRISAAKGNADAVSRGDIIVLAVKPGEISKVLAECAEHVTPKKIVVSIAAGVPISELQAPLPKKAKVIRAMPNTPALIGEGITVLSAGKNVTGRDLDLVSAIFDTVGQTAVVDEKRMDAVTGLSGSGPAFVAMFIEGLIDAGVFAGLTRELAKTLAVQTVLGSAKMLREKVEHPSQLKDMVTSPAGTTIAGVRVLEEEGFRTVIMDAIEAAVERSKELGKSRGT